MIKKQKLIPILIGGLILYLISTGVSYAAFRFLIGPVTSGLISPVPVEEARSRVDLTAPKNRNLPS